MNKTIAIYVVAGEKYSGAEIVLERLFLSNKENIEPIILCCKNGAYAERQLNNGLNVYTTKGLSNIRFNNSLLNKVLSPFSIIFKLVQVFIKLQFLYKKYKGEKLYIHANLVSSGFYVLPFLIFSKLLKRKCKFIWSHLDASYHGMPPFIHKLWLLNIYFFDLTLVPSLATKVFVSDSSEKIKVFYNGVDIAKYRFDEKKRQVFRDSLSLNKSIITLGIAGQIAEFKGHLILLKAFHQLLEDGFNIHLVIIGRLLENFKDKFEVKINSINSEIESITVLENTSDLSYFYSGIDILINATLNEYAEPLGTTIIEGMSYGRIAIASNSGGSPEIIDNKIDGYLFEADNSNSLYMLLKDIIKNFEHQKYVQTNSVRKVANKFSADQAAKTYNELISSL